MIEYPDFDSYRHKVAELEKLDWYRYWSGKTVLGVDPPVRYRSRRGDSWLPAN